MLTIDGRLIQTSIEPYIIAELSANHNGSIDRAKLSIKSAKENGAHAIKFQTYTPETMTIDCDRDDFIVKGGLWDGYKLYDLYSKAHTPFNWHKELFDYAKEIGITAFSSPFDETAVDLLEELNVPAYKIASFELTDVQLIKYVASKNKPMLMSTGMATESEISEAVIAARDAGCNSILLFHCISSYPATAKQANLRQIINLKEKYGVEVGLSDHTIGNTVAIAAIAIGASAIEKHFTLSRNEEGPDSTFSIEPNELKSLVSETADAWLSLGHGGFSRSIDESASMIFRRSLYFVNNIRGGQIISSSDIRRIRPGYGLPSKFLDDIVGKIAKRDILRGEPVKWELIN